MKAAVLGSPIAHSLSPLLHRTGYASLGLDEWSYQRFELTADALPGFLAGLTDFLMSHEPDLMAFCAATDTSPETVAAAWHHFSGPGLDSGVY